MFAYMAEKVIKNKLIFIFASFMAIFFPAYFAGCRDLDVGFDVLYYGYGIYESAHFSTSFMDLISREPKTELFYLFVNYISVLLHDNIHFTLGFISFVTLLFAYLACYLLRKDTKLWLLYSGFMFITFATSMNILRQSLAVSVSFYAYSIIKKKGLCPHLYLVSLIAMLSHNTAILAIGSIYAFHFMSNLTKQNFSKYFKLFLVIITTFLLGISYIITLLEVIFARDYSVYFTGETDAEWAQTVFPLTFFLTAGIFIIVYLRAYKKHLIQAKDIQEFKCIVTIFICCLLLGALFTGSMLRLASYYIIYIIYGFCIIICSKKLSIKQRATYKFLIHILYLIIYIKTLGPNVLYSSSILGL